ncbi:F0F1 ATP synthase subunit delta [Candidatus Saccharibacteria bacterium]|nr:F0F1 ATP synthase subunit delta [Candidatus Saccharibacteria bacterium]
MKFVRSELAAVIGEKTLHITDFRALAREVAAYLIEQNSASELESLMRDVLVYRQDHGIVEAEVTSAHELGDETLKQVKNLLETHYPNAKHVVVHDSQDVAVIGGLKVQMAREQLDMSVRAKLDKFRRLTTEGIL